MLTTSEKIALDNYITRDNTGLGGLDWFELMYDNLSDEAIELVEKNEFDGSDLEAKWTDRLMYKLYSPKQAGKILDRLILGRFKNHN